VTLLSAFDSQSQASTCDLFCVTLLGNLDVIWAGSVMPSFEYQARNTALLYRLDLLSAHAPVLEVTAEPQGSGREPRTPYVQHKP